VEPLSGEEVVVVSELLDEVLPEFDVDELEFVESVEVVVFDSFPELVLVEFEVVFA
jgi:hypothetical protein